MRISNTGARAFALALLLPVAGGLIRPASPADPETRRLHDLFDADWQWNMRTFPEWATYVGDHRYGDRLEDRSLEADATYFAHARERLAQLASIDRAKLSPADRVSYDILGARHQAVDREREACGPAHPCAQRDGRPAHWIRRAAARKPGPNRDGRAQPDRAHGRVSGGRGPGDSEDARRDGCGLGHVPFVARARAGADRRTAARRTSLRVRCTSRSRASGATFPKQSAPSSRRKPSAHCASRSTRRCRSCAGSSWTNTCRVRPRTAR